MTTNNPFTGRPFEVPNFEFEEGYIVRDRRQGRVTVGRLGHQIDQQEFDAQKRKGYWGPLPEYHNFMSSYLLFHSDPKDNAEDAQWLPVRMLGEGGFGRVGLWEKRDATDGKIDELVCKETDLRLEANPYYPEEVDEEVGRPRLLREAVIQRDINKQYPGVTPHLRRYKFLAERRGLVEGRYRFYMEFCPHGTLERLRRLYRCWDTYLPEVFVWHVFLRLATAGEALRAAPPDDTVLFPEKITMDKTRNAFCIHLDMKPVNVLLGSPDPKATNQFPDPLLNDFGISEYTWYGNYENNPFDLWQQGTHSYKPPEQRRYGANWKLPPTGAAIRSHDEQQRRLNWNRAQFIQKMSNVNETGDTFFDHAMNIYGIGIIMYYLVTLREEGHLGRIRAKSVKKFRENGYHQISGVRTKKPGVYSSRLCHLIHRCLDPNPANRPSQLELYDETFRGLKLAHRRARRAGQHPVKIYFRDHEINDMPLGDARFEPLYDDWKRFITGGFPNPDIPPLKFPEDKYRDFPDFRRKTGWKKLVQGQDAAGNWFEELVWDSRYEARRRQPGGSDNPLPNPNAQAQASVNANANAQPNASAQPRGKGKGKAKGKGQSSAHAPKQHNLRSKSVQPNAPAQPTAAGPSAATQAGGGGGGAAAAAAASAVVVVVDSSSSSSSS